MIELLVPSPLWAEFRTRLSSQTSETCGVLYANPLERRSGDLRLLAERAEYPTAADYSSVGPTSAELRPSFVAATTKAAARKGQSLVFCHTHPFESWPAFSTVDDAGEAALAAFLARRQRAAVHGAIVIGSAGVAARVLGGDLEMRVIEIGSHRRLLGSVSETAGPTKQDVFDRQRRAFGQAGQQMLSQLDVAIVGLGGTGSIVAQQLAYLGVKAFRLVDHDVVEATNLNRLVGAVSRDIGSAKAEIARRAILAIKPDASVQAITDSIIRTSIARRITDCDAIIGCTDTHGSRAIIHQIAYQYLIPCFDLGTAIVTRDGRVSHVSGRTQMLAPGLPCLSCSGVLDSHQVRRDQMSRTERKSDPYWQDGGEPAPSVISINGTVASLAVTMFLQAMVGIPGDARHLVYDAIQGRLRAVTSMPRPRCAVCSGSGVEGRGDTEPIWGRRD